MVGSLGGLLPMQFSDGLCLPTLGLIVKLEISEFGSTSVGQSCRQCNFCA